MLKTVRLPMEARRVWNYQLNQSGPAQRRRVSIKFLFNVGNRWVLLHLIIRDVTKTTP
jgi:hypothetical protein